MVLKYFEICLYLFLLTCIYGMPAPNLALLKSEFLIQNDYHNKQILPLFIVNLSHNDVNPKCQQKLGEIFSNFLSNPGLSQIISNSGKGPNDLGDYVSCKLLENEYYYITIGVLIGNIWAGIGVCLPTECDYDTICSIKPNIAEILTQVLKVPVTKEQVILDKTREENARRNTIKPGFYLFMGGLILIFGIVIFATIIEYNGFIDKNNETILFKILLCFSLQRNIKGILNTENRIDNKLNVLNGIRVLSIAWVVLGHSFFTLLYYPLLNPLDLMDDAVYSGVIGFIKSGTLAVDIFFFLSGFLAALSMYKGFKDRKNRTVKNILLAYFYRYVRLWPIMIIMILYAIYIEQLIHDTPTSTKTEGNRIHCEDQWVWTLLMVNNFVNIFGDLCIPWVWYLFIDMQLYIITPFVIIAYLWKRKIGLIIIAAICAASAIILSWISAYYSYSLSPFKYDPTKDVNTMTYAKPYCRLHPYFIGILLYLLYAEGTNSRFKKLVYENRIIRYIGFYGIGILLMYLVVYSFYWIDANQEKWGDTFGTFHMVASRPLFIIGLSLVLYPVLIGRGKILLAIFGHFIFNPLGKLTYGVYMIHLNLMFIFCFSVLQGKYYVMGDIFINALMQLFLSYTLSFVLTLVFESPIVQLLKTFLEDSRRSNQTKKIETEAETEKTPIQNNEKN